MEIEVSPLTEALVMNGLRVQRRYGLLTNDSLIVSAMLRSGVPLLATADQGFQPLTRSRHQFPAIFAEVRD